MAGGLDWPNMMRAGLYGLGLTPDAFWRLTPAELRLMLGLEQAVPVFDRARLEDLMARFPDKADMTPERSEHGRHGTI